MKNVKSNNIEKSFDTTALIRAAISHGVWYTFSFMCSRKATGGPPVANFKQHFDASEVR